MEIPRPTPAESLGDDRGREAEFNRLNRLYAALSHVNQAIVRRGSRDQLLASACQILVEQGGFRMAWIGWHDPESQRLMPVASFGDDDQYLSRVKIYGDDRPEGRGPTGTSFREDRPYICNDLRADPATLPWRAEAERRGFRSSAVVLIREGGRPRGTLSVYGSEVGIFQDREMATLVQVADDVSFGLDHLASAAATTRALERLTEAQRIGQIGDWEFVLVSGAITWSPQTFEILGRDPSLGPPLNYEANAAIYEPASAALMSEKVAAAIASGEDQEYELVALHPDGRRVFVQAKAVPRKDRTGKVVGLTGTVQDVSARKRAELLMRESEARLSYAMEAAAIGDWDMDLRTNVARRSLRHDQCFGYAELLPQWGYDIFLAHIDPADRAHVDACFQKAMVGEGEYDDEFRTTWADGSVHWLWTRGRFYFDEAGRPYRVAGIVVDVSERKKAEAAVRESEQRYRTLFERAPDGIVIIEPSGHYVDVNAVICQMLGYTREEMIGRHASTVVVPAEIPHIQAGLDEVRAGADYHREWQFRRKDGSVFSAEAVATQMPNGHTIGILRDITERKQVESALRESEGKLRKVIDGLGPYMFVGLMTPDGVLIEANRPALEAAGMRPEDVLGKPLAETYWWAWSDAVQAQLLAAIARAAAGEPSRYDVQVRVAEAKLIWLDFSLFPVHDAGGNVILLVPSASVIDERKKVEAALRELAHRRLHAEDEERRRIAKELHDSTAQDLAAVLLNLGTLHDSLPSLGTAPASIIEDSMALLDNAAHEIRTLSFALHPMRFDEVGLPGGLAEYAAGLGKRAGLRIGVEFEANLGRLREDSEHALFRVAQESLRNVVRHSGSDTATIRLMRPGANIVLEIEDQGRGLPPDLATRPGAYGVGIAGMRERLEHLGGRLDIVSGDGGTTVRAVLPADGGET